MDAAREQGLAKLRATRAKRAKREDAFRAEVAAAKEQSFASWQAKQAKRAPVGRHHNRTARIRNSTTPFAAAREQGLAKMRAKRAGCTRQSQANPNLERNREQGSADVLCLAEMRAERA